MAAVCRSRSHGGRCSASIPAYFSSTVSTASSTDSTLMIDSCRETYGRAERSACVLRGAGVRRRAHLPWHRHAVRE